MLSQECLRELNTAWLPNITDSGLDRLIELLEQGSPLLVHGCFTRSLPMGCLATHAAWHHPLTAHLTVDAGITWLHQVAGLNPATSVVLQEWDRWGPYELGMRFRTAPPVQGVPLGSAADESSGQPYQLSAGSLTDNIIPLPTK